MVPAEGTDTNDTYSNYTFVSQTVIFSDRGLSRKGYDPGQEIAGIARDRRNRRDRKPARFTRQRILARKCTKSL
jgi:hypothetical protein